MARKIQVKLVMQLRDSGLSRSEISRSHHMSKNSVCEVFSIAEERKIHYYDIADKTDDECYRIFYPNRHQEEIIYELPNYERVHGELPRDGVTLKLLWKEYKDHCTAQQTLPYGYSKFCDGYSDYVISKQLTNRLSHKPGFESQVDWSGPTMQLVAPATGEVSKVYLFVATLPYSQYTYVEPCLSMNENSWLQCNVHMFEFWGGTTTRIVCDNLKTGVIRHPKDGEIVLNEAYEALGNYYLTAIMPAQVRKPKQKASVEGAVGKIASAIIARLRNVEFHSMEELRSAVNDALYDFNHTPFQKRDGCRYDVFQAEESAYLRPLPAIPYEIASWVYNRAVYLDCHVVLDKNHYSCPYQYVGKKVDLKLTDSLVEIYYKETRIATHRRFPQHLSNQWSTHPEDMPDQFQKMEWDDQRILKWARSIGPNTSEVVQRIFAGVQVKEQGYNSCLAVLRLSKKYTAGRLEAACGLALTRFHAPRYRHMAAILSAEEDLIYSRNKQAVQCAEAKKTQGYVRGAAYYGGHEDD